MKNPSQKLTLRITDFIRTGLLNEISIGSSKSEVLDILGPPTDRSIRTDPLIILKYGHIQLSFHQAHLTLIALYFKENPESSAIIFLDENQYREQNYKAIFAMLDQIGIVISPYDPLSFDTQLCYKTENGVYLLIDRNSERIISIQYRS
jgi:hypothetical protein